MHVRFKIYPKLNTVARKRGPANSCKYDLLPCVSVSGLETNKMRPTGVRLIRVRSFGRLDFIRLVGGGYWPVKRLFSEQRM
jgi:hypothetical protein